MDNQTRRKRPQGPSRRRRPRQGQNMTISRPPPIQDLGLKRETRIRFLASGAFSSNITFQNLLDIFNVAATAVTAFDLFTLVKVKRVEIWANALANASATVTLIYSGTGAQGVGDQRIHTDSSMGIEPAHIVAVPDPMTVAAFYQLSSSDTAFFLNVPAGAVVDVSLSFRNPVVGSGNAVQNAPVAATVGALYYRGLDGQALAGSKFTPTGVIAVD
jgi:hypothetical protein